MSTNSSLPRTLAIDIGGTGIKIMVLSKSAEALTERLKVPTPKPATPKACLKAIVELVTRVGEFERVSVGFPGVVRHGVVKTAPNLDDSWHDFDLAHAIETTLKKPTRVANDAAVQGLGDIKGSGVEMVITLGTGMGSALYVDGNMIPLELGHHPFSKGKTYEQLLGKAALREYGTHQWNKHLLKALLLMDRIFNFDHLYIGGGNAKHVHIDLPKNVEIASNLAGLWGGVKLWSN